MKEIHLLGTSHEPIAIVFDLLLEVYNKINFKIYPNISEPIAPSLPIKDIAYEMMPLGTVPDENASVFISSPGPKNKKAIFDFFQMNNRISKERYFNIIHSSSYVAQSSVLSHGVLIEPHVVVSSQSHVGFGVFVKRGSLIGHHNRIGDFVDINPGVTLSGGVKLGNGCTIGSGTVIKEGIKIGENSIIGMGSVVTKDIPPNCVAFGNPCRVVREL